MTSSSPPRPPPPRNLRALHMSLETQNVPYLGFFPLGAAVGGPVLQAVASSLVPQNWAAVLQGVNNSRGCGPTAVKPVVGLVSRTTAGLQSLGYLDWFVPKLGLHTAVVS